jgi:hypothetical protein
LGTGGIFGRCQIREFLHFHIGFTSALEWLMCGVRAVKLCITGGDSGIAFGSRVVTFVTKAIAVLGRQGGAHHEKRAAQNSAQASGLKNSGAR